MTVDAQSSADSLQHGEVSAGDRKTSQTGGWFAMTCLLLAAALLRIWFASYQLDDGRFWDERYSLRNVAAVLEGGRPIRALYPSLSFLPHTAVLAASEGLYALTRDERFAVFSDRSQRRFSPTGYLLSRLVSVAFGVWSIWLVYGLGRRLFGHGVGLLAAVFLAAHWRHITASAEFKPDSVAVAFILLAFGWSLDAIKRPSWRTFLLAGVGVGLATAAKYNAAGISIALVVGVLVSDWKSPRLWRWLVLAGLASLLTFSMLNPWWSMVLKDFAWQLNYYERVGVRNNSSHAQVALAEAEFLLRHHGAFVVSFVALGCLGMARRVLQRQEEYRDLAMLLGFFLGYSVLYAAATELFLSQNYLPVAPFTSIIAAWAVFAWSGRLTSSFPLLNSRLMRGLAWSALLVLCFRFPVLATYREVVPTTSRVAAEFLQNHLRLTLGSLVMYETMEEPLRVTHGGHWVPALRFESFRELEAHRLDRADAELFAAARLEGEDGDFYLRRLTRGQVVRAERFGPRWFAARGPELVLLLHPWRRQGEILPLLFERLADGERCQAELAGLLQPGEVFSLVVRFPRGRNATGKVERFELGSRTEVMYRTRANDDASHFSTQRLALAAEASALILACEGAAEAPHGKVYRWRSEKGGRR